jgi:2-oxoglutarate dehydrogenase E2 component (dihydrolipoamide succinyltransferase)
MAIELRVPEVGESVREVEIGEWMKSAGDLVAAEEPLVVIETDKVSIDLIAPSAGKISQILKQQGEGATVGEVIGYIEPGAGPNVATAAQETPRAAAVSAPPAVSKATPTPPALSKATPTPPAAPAGATTPPPIVMPAAARVMAEQQVEAAAIQGSGPGGRVLKEDVVAAKAASLPRGGRGEEIVPMTRLRRRIAERLVQSQNEAAILTTFNEVDMSAVMTLRRAHKDRFTAAHGQKLGFMSFFVKAAIEALKAYPAVNAEIRGTDIVYRPYYDIGVAVGGGKGLVVPVLRDAQRLGFAQIEGTIVDFSARAKAGTLQIDELTGGTFTISNGGVYGSLLSTPIINPPQSGILGLHAIQERAVVHDGAVVVRPMMYLALSYDHRIIDGREAVGFLVRIKECVEDPARILLEV